MLEVKKLEVVYHHVSTAVQGVSFSVKEKSMFAIIGANGAGKTTTLRAISGFLGIDNAEITDGEIYLAGKRLNGLPPNKIAGIGVVLVPERNKVFETLTTGENLAILAGGRGGDRSAIDRIYGYFPALNARKGSLAGLLSGGERQMLAMGQALLCSPRLLLVDELSQGLAPLATSHLITSLVKLKRELGLTIAIVEQNAAVALRIADYAVVMENGRVVFDGSPERLMQHEDVKEFYLGTEDGEERTYRDVKQYRRSRRWWG